MTTYLGNEGFKLPGIDLLKKPGSIDPSSNIEDAERYVEQVNEFFVEDKIDAQVVGYTMGSAITELQVQLGKKGRKAHVTKVKEDLQLQLGVKSVSINQIEGTSLLGIAVPNKKVLMVPFADIVEDGLKTSNPLEVAIGKDIQGNIIRADIDEMPHLLAAGITKSGKSVGINVLMCGIMMKNRPDEVKFVMIDPKKVEFARYEGLPNLWKPVITDVREAADTLQEVLDEMDRRYDVLKANAKRNDTDYNAMVEEEWSQGKFEREKLFKIVVVIDEFASLMIQYGKEVESIVNRLGAEARAAGIHLIIATQKPSAEVIPTLIRDNLPGRMSFRLATSRSSEMVIGAGGAENLLGYGDMLFSPKGDIPIRVQGSFLSDDEVEGICKHLKAQPWEELTIKPKEEEPKEDADTEDEDEEPRYKTREIEPEMGFTGYKKETDPVDAQPEVKEVVNASSKGDTTSKDAELDEVSSAGQALMDEMDTFDIGVEPQPIPVDTTVEDNPFNQFNEDEDSAFSGSINEGLYGLNHGQRGSAYGRKDSPQELVEAIARDILTKGVHLLEVEGAKPDELFIRLMDARGYTVGPVGMLVFDVELYGINEKHRKYKVSEDGYKISVATSLNNESQLLSVGKATVEYFNNRFGYEANLVNIGDFIVHGVHIKPFIKMDPQSSVFKGFLMSNLKDEWLNTMMRDWVQTIKEHNIVGMSDVKHLASKIEIGKDSIVVSSMYRYKNTNGQSGEFEQKREFPNKVINNPRYEEAFNQIIDGAVVNLNLKYNKGEISGAQFLVRFEGIYGVPQRWNNIIGFVEGSGKQAFDMGNLRAYYDRCMALGLEVERVNGYIFRVKGEPFDAVCSSNGFYLDSTPLGYIKGETTLEALEKHQQKLPVLKKLLVVYNLRVRDLSKYIK